MAELSVDIEVNTGSAVSNVKTLGQSFSDAARELLEIVDAGKRAGKSTEDIARDISRKYGTAFDDAKLAVDKLDTALDEMRRSGGKAGDGIEDSLQDVERAAKRAEDAVDDIGTNGSTGLRRVGDTSREVGQEIRQNLGEGIASAARGDFESLADTIGDTLGGAVAGIGGIGTAALGVAGALGIGALIAAFQLVEEQRKKLEERASDLARAYIDAGTNVLDAMTIASRASDFLADPEKRKETERLSEVLGVSMPEAARALAGDLNALSAANEIVKANEDERLRLMQESANYMSGDFSTAERDRLTRLLDQRVAVDDLNAANGMANQTFQDQQRLLVELINSADGVVKEVDEVGNAVYRLPDGTQILIDAETGQATTDVSKFKGDVDGIPDVVTSTVRLRVDSSAWDNYIPKFKTGVIAVNPRIGREWE